MSDGVSCGPQADDGYLHADVLASRLLSTLLQLRRHHERAGTTMAIHGPTPRMQWSILRTIIERGPTRCTDLAAELEVTPSTISIAIKRLVQLHMVTQARSSSDRRVSYFDVTQRGKRIHSQIAGQRGLSR